MERIKDITNNGESMFVSTYNYGVDDWFTPEYQNNVAHRVYDLFGERELFNNTLDKVRNQIQWLFIANAYRYNTIYETTVAVYNPMENYDMHEVTTVNGTNNTGAQANTSTVGQQVNSGTDNSNVFAFDSTDAVANATGADSNTLGSRSDSSNIGAREDSHSENIQKDIHGNLGVMAGQDLIQKSRDIAELSLIDIMALDVAHCISLAIY